MFISSPSGGATLAMRMRAVMPLSNGIDFLRTYQTQTALLMNLTHHQRGLLSEKLKQEPRVIAAYLMGSVLKSHFRKDSDIDIAILPAPGSDISLMTRLEMAAALSTILHHPVDIGLLGTQDLIYAKETIVKGECIFCRDKYARDLFAATALSLYLQLKQQRVEVEHAYTA